MRPKWPQPSTRTLSPGIMKFIKSGRSMLAYSSIHIVTFIYEQFACSISQTIRNNHNMTTISTLIIVQQPLPRRLVKLATSSQLLVIAGYFFEKSSLLVASYLAPVKVSF